MGLRARSRVSRRAHSFGHCDEAAVLIVQYFRLLRAGTHPKKRSSLCGSCESFVVDYVIRQIVNFCVRLLTQRLGRAPRARAVRSAKSKKNTRSTLLALLSSLLIYDVEQRPTVGS